MALFEQNAGNGLPLLVDVAIDLQTGLPLEKNGKPVLLTGLQALRQWVHFALAPESRRFAYAAHTADYGKSPAGNDPTGAGSESVYHGGHRGDSNAARGRLCSAFHTGDGIW